MAIKGIPCGHSGCGHSSPDGAGNLNHGALHFTASVMGNPEYLSAVENVKQAPDQRMVGLEKVNSFHAASHTKQRVRQMARNKKSRKKVKP